MLGSTRFQTRATILTEAHRARVRPAAAAAHDPLVGRWRRLCNPEHGCAEQRARSRTFGGGLDVGSTLGAESALGRILRTAVRACDFAVRSGTGRELELRRRGPRPNRRPRFRGCWSAGALSWERNAARRCWLDHAAGCWRQPIATILAELQMVGILPAAAVALHGGARGTSCVAGRQVLRVAGAHHRGSGSRTSSTTSSATTCARPKPRYLSARL
jgi:hypothetical protein